MAAGGKIGLLHNFAKGVLSEAVAAQIKIARQSGEDEQRHQSGQRQSDRAFPIHDSPLKKPVRS